MELVNANKICLEVGGYKHCKKCPLYAVCSAEYENTAAYDAAMENAAIEYLKGRTNNE